jgi:hypothetical protein
MPNTNVIYLKKGESKKDKEIKKYKRRARGLLILLIIVGFVALTQIIQNMFQSSNQSGAVVVNYLNETILNNTNRTITSTAVCQESLTSTIIKGITTFMDKLFESPGGFWVKFFIFMGIIYLIQVVFSLVFDVIELVLLVFVAIKRLIVWIYRKITGRDKNEERLKQISELK